MSAPKLLNGSNIVLPKDLFNDFQLVKILNAHTIALLQTTCETSEILRRNELFALLEHNGNVERMETALSTLLGSERSLQRLNEVEIQLERYYRTVEAYELYIDSCELLASMNDLGSLFSEVANYFSTNHMKTILFDLKESAKKIRTLLKNMCVGLLSFSDKKWVTPDYDAESEFDLVEKYAKNLGFSCPKRKFQNTKINYSLSDALCRLYSDEVSQIESEIAKHAGVDLREPTAYIPEIKFYLEIYGLINKATKIGVPHCIPKIAEKPKYIATQLYDVSLLAKGCETVVPNDAEFTENESFYFLLGANGGGKTTYLRAVGINLILFLSGCPVFAEKAEIYPFDIIISHFPKDERFNNIGRLSEEKARTEEMINVSKNKVSFLFFNETFSGTDDKRGFELLSDTATQIGIHNHFGIFVTHFHEVMSLDFPVLSAEVDLSDGNKRTFRIVRSKGSSSSYAADILKKYKIDKDSLEARRSKNGD